MKFECIELDSKADKKMYAKIKKIVNIALKYGSNQKEKIPAFITFSVNDLTLDIIPILVETQTTNPWKIIYSSNKFIVTDEGADIANVYRPTYLRLNENGYKYTKTIIIDLNKIKKFIETNTTFKISQDDEGYLFVTADMFKPKNIDGISTDLLAHTPHYFLTDRNPTNTDERVFHTDRMMKEVTEKMLDSNYALNRINVSTTITDDPALLSYVTTELNSAKGSITLGYYDDYGEPNHIMIFGSLVPYTPKHMECYRVTDYILDENGDIDTSSGVVVAALIQDINNARIIIYYGYRDVYEMLRDDYVEALNNVIKMMEEKETDK